jgi:hypothetical protein
LPICNTFTYIEIPCFKPANGETIVIETPHGVPVDIEPGLVQQLKGNCHISIIIFLNIISLEETADVNRSAKRTKQMRGTLIIKDGVSDIDYFCKIKKIIFSVFVLFDHRQL